jgi:hypothetical protein
MTALGFSDKTVLHPSRHGLPDRVPARPARHRRRARAADRRDHHIHRCRAYHLAHDCVKDRLSWYYHGNDKDAWSRLSSSPKPTTSTCKRSSAGRLPKAWGLSSGRSKTV